MKSGIADMEWVQISGELHKQENFFLVNFVQETILNVSLMFSASTKTPNFTLETRKSADAEASGYSSLFFCKKKDKTPS